MSDSATPTMAPELLKPGASPGYPEPGSTNTGFFVHPAKLIYIQSNQREDEP